MFKRYVLITLTLLAAGLGLATMPAAGSVPAGQATIVVDASDVTGTVRSLQGLNAGPRGRDRQAHLFRQYEDIGVDYVRTHDYYGPADMHVLFPDLGADPDDETSYDFTSTDRELEAIKRVGAEVLFRLGESWGSPVTYVAPQDYQAWAQAAVHVAMHYNDGWADGFHWGIEYWEVWNEPDITQFWTGTPEEYYQFYEAVARALKAYDPGLKVGGPGLCCQDAFFADFLAYCRDHDVPLDFVSWHRYAGGSAPYTLLQRAEQVQRALDFYGFGEAENLLTEWNISVEGDYEHLRDAAGAAWTVSALTYLQDSTVSIANRYRGDGGLGMFTAEGLYTGPAYSFLAFRWMLETPQRLTATGSDTDGYAVLAGRTPGETSEVWSPMVQVLISDYNSSYTGFDLTVTDLPWGSAQPYRYERYLLDETHNLTLVESADVPAGSVTFATSEPMTGPSVQLIRLFVPAGQPLPRIEINAGQPLGTISPLLYGLNHRYLNSGYGVWDATAEQVHPEVISRSQQIGFPVARFPGGTVSSTYHWTDGIGPPEKRPTGISGFNGAPATNEYGFDEQMLFVEQVGATTNVVVNFGTGTAQEAAAWVAYANGAVTDTTPIGLDGRGADWGTVGEWAARREANQIRMGMAPHPYNIEYWEVGNELYGDWEYTWTHNPIRYAAGGTAWQYDQRVVKAGDWQDRVSRSSGRPSQVFFVRYPPVVTSTQTITVAGAVWTEVPDLSAAGPDDAVYEFDPQHSEIRFGDGVHGRIPPLGALILATYESGPHGGFVDYYAATKAVDPDIKVGSCMYSDSFLQVMGEEYAYDFLAVHPYFASGDRDGDLDQAHLRTVAGPLIKGMDLEDLRAAIDLYAGDRAGQASSRGSARGVEIAITEYNLVVAERNSPTPHYGMSLDQGLFVADMLRTLIEQGIPLGDLHALIDAYAGEGWGNTPVLSPYPQLIPRPAAYVLQLFNQHFASAQVESRVEDAPLLTGSLPALEIVASRDVAGDRLTLLAINKEATASVTATVAISGFTPSRTATVWTLNGSNIAAFNDVGHPTDVRVTESTIADAAESFVYAFPAHSVTLIELKVAPPASRCVGDANANGIGDVVDIQATASELPCQVYLPLVAAQWRQPWPAPSAGPPYPRLARLTWYEPGNFVRSLSDRTGGQITIDDPNHTALVDFLAAHQRVVVSGRVLAGDYPGVQTDRDRLARARDEAGFLLLGRWETGGIELDRLNFTNTQPGSPFPFVPEWFVQEVAVPLPQAVLAGDTALPIAEGEQNAYCVPREDYLNDQVIVLDGERSEAVKLDCDAWDGSSLTIPLTRDSALRASYDFGVFKYDHAAGTPLRFNASPSWDAWWGYNMTDVGPMHEGRRWNEHRPRIIYNQFGQVRDSRGRLVLDGVELDTFNQEFFGPYNSSRPVVQRLDLDTDGQPDLTQPDPPYEPANCFPDYYTGQPNWDNCAWAAGHTTFARNLLALWGADPELTLDHDIVIQLGFGENAPYVNGELFENLPSLELAADPEANRWETAYAHYAYWQSQGRSPSVNLIEGGYGIYSGDGGRDDLALMRLSLAFTLMGNGYFVYDGGACCHGNTLWWYDEYAVDSHGRAIGVYDPEPVHPLVNIDTDLLEEGQFAATVRPGLGYLGYPVTDAYTVTAGIYRRDFDRGIVVANFGFDAVTLSLERPYRKILGIQDCDTNDGSLVSGLTLPAKDAIILLDPAYFDSASSRCDRPASPRGYSMQALQGGNRSGDKTVSIPSSAKQR